MKRLIDPHLLIGAIGRAIENRSDYTACVLSEVEDAIAGALYNRECPAADPAIVKAISEALVEPETTILPPGVYSCFRIHENGTWDQPIYRILEPMAEGTFMRRVFEESSRKVFVVTCINEDDDAPEEHVVLLTA